MSLKDTLKEHPGYNYKLLELYSGQEIAFFYKMEMDDDECPYIDDCFVTNMFGTKFNPVAISDKEWQALKDQTFNRAVAARERMLRGYTE